MEVKPSTPAASNTDIPLCVDLDGTLILSDMLWESALQLIRRHPFTALAAPFWLLRGRAHLKRRIAANSYVEIASLPWNKPFLDWLRLQKAAGRRLILATAAEESLAHRIADYVGIFDGVAASDGATNLKGKNKARLLVERFGANFDYAGNSGSDREIWSVCRGIVAVETSPGLTRELRKTGRIVHESVISRQSLVLWLRELRVSSWIGNLLVFAPIAVARPISEWDAVKPAIVCFVCFCLMSSSAYLAADLLDLTADRADIGKKIKPLAAGEIAIPSAVVGSFISLAAGLLLAAIFIPNATPILTVYAIGVIAASLYCKHPFPLRAAVTCALLLLRPIAEALASDIPIGRYFGF